MFAWSAACHTSEDPLPSELMVVEGTVTTQTQQSVAGAAIHAEMGLYAFQAGGGSGCVGPVLASRDAHTGSSGIFTMEFVRLSEGATDRCLRIAVSPPVGASLRDTTVVIRSLGSVANLTVVIVLSDERSM